MIEQKLESEGFNVIYTDEPGSSRSGPGDTAKINLAFEHLYDRTPDLVTVRSDETLLIIEVDDRFKNHLPAKYEEYNNKRDRLLMRISGVLNTELQTLEFGFGTPRKSLPEINISHNRSINFISGCGYGNSQDH